MSSFDDATIISTANEAFLSKLAASNKGYFKDDFLPYFNVGGIIPKKPPIINRGYFGRVECINKVIYKFIRINNITMKQSINRTLLFIFVFLLVLFYFIFATNPYGLVKHFRITMMFLCLVTLFGFLIFIEYYTHQEIYQSDTHSELGPNFIKYVYNCRA